MNHLKAQVKLVELKAQMDELKIRPSTELVLMTEKNNSVLEAKFELSSTINTLLKEIKGLLTQKAPLTITLPLHQKLSGKSIHISNQILNAINAVRF